ncbi:Asp-tRNA(Asn)/Glu-tRNA(Gln) amidotransferase subunit GatC [Candidatus Wolfebacteria bacterium]|nr:Asp-tRNA(Asn)/Glu-tRNA(Gln) amidotransferase subunit GatC [Candidatus Wolfebacteria bacterium]
MLKITKETLEYLAGLGKLRIKKEDEEKLLRDLEKILAHFEELKELDTEGVEPLSGIAGDFNVFREDDLSADLRGLDADQRRISQRESALNQRQSALIEAFPEKENGFLKVPAVFE